MEEQLSVPKIRFEGFNGEWERYEIEKLADRYDNLRVPISESNRIPGNTPYYGANGIQGYVKGYTHKGEYILIAEDGANDLKNYPVQYVNGKIWVNNHAHVLQAKFDVANTRYLGYSISQTNIEPFLVGGGRAKLNASTMMKIPVSAPKNIQEQIKIGEFLSNIDSLITNSQKKYKKLQAIKKALLEKIFPKNGENVPEIRFDEFTDTWQQQRLFEMGESFEYGLNASAKEFDGKNKYLRITDIDESSRQFLEKELTSPETNLDLADNFKLEYGDILFARTGASVGKSYIYKKKDGIVYYAGYLIRVRVKQTYYPEFVFYNTLTDNYRKYIYITSQLLGQPGVNAKEYANYTLKIPSINEQKKIGDFFLKLDNTIRLHKEKHDRLLNIKKALLEKMFV